ncbi:type I polyketide synthase [Actinosynnema mirum]|uniref:Beta-ketoacyl synthase n=1 Tax=Actinosynnema mirum (strain ATCC 29888 / DSM 43827 / JCM 3225 / NBRC 14064 / NCIMB 13271 / NRRL B-12336 / IMRU 3971 / 101) TaxID=446462 RepID=C6WL79_ACTMD|nr:type I polyketide synthase [Actinosynnema mirum]ACU36432.1 Beta-ketoacyl synthase [Actinosynnema mirum DSM 43827]
MTGVTEVAITGMAVLLPGAPDLDSYWRNIVGGVDAITEVPPDRWDPGFYDPAAHGTRRADRVYCRRGGFVDAAVDAAGFGVMPRSVPGTEPDQLIALQVAADAIADAGGESALPADRRRVGVVLGRGGYLTPGLVRLDQRVRTATQLVTTLRELVPELDEARLERVRASFTEQLGPEAPEAAIGLVPNLAASRVANRLDLRGPAYTVDAACASSLVAVDHAVRELATGRCDVVLAGGVHHCHDITLWSVFSQLGALSPSQRVRPFHRDADGVLIGEGTGVVVLKRLADAERDGDRVYAVISGTGVASDGRSASLLNPAQEGQARAVRQAWDAAGLDPRAPGAIGLLEAHGTGTPAGDGAELATLAEVFGPADGPRAVLGSVKSMIGHTMPAAGVAGLVKAALALHHKVLPPTLHCDDPHPALEATRFAPIGRARAWEGDGVRRAGVNAFGFGGINAHVVLQEPLRANGRTGPVEVVEPTRVLRLAARTPAELLALLDNPVSLAETERTHLPCRVGIVDPTDRKLALARRAVAKGAPWRGRSDIWFTPTPLGGRTAFLFPGLEAEFTPEVADVAARFGLPWRDTGARVGDVGGHGAAVFQVGRLLDAALRRVGVRPDAVAGHSVGEWTAMAVGGIHSAEEVDAFLDGFDPASLQVPGVVFAVLGASADEVVPLLAGHPDVVLSHDNAPSQSMVCGPEAEVEAVVAVMRGRGVISRVLPFRSGFHTPMLEPYLGPIRDGAARFTLHPPRVPVWSATTASPFPAEPDEVRALFVRHLLEPVRFRPLVRAMHDAGFRAFVQLGAGQLGSLVADGLSADEHLVVSAHGGLAQLRRVVTALWAHGADPDVTPLLDVRPPANPSAARSLPARSLSANGVPERRRTPVKLDLGGALVSLPLEQRAPLVPAAPARGLDLGDGPLAAELTALLRETADAAARITRAGGTAAPQRFPAAPPQVTPPPADVPTSIRFDLATMPHLIDHCFFRQREGWPDDADRWPVVPATTVITHLMELAERAAPGKRAVAVHDVRLLQWIVAEPATEVAVRVEPLSPNRIRVVLEGCSQAEVELADQHPAAPEPWPLDRPERVPDLTAERFYGDRWMFHGPRFQGVTDLIAVGERHVRGTIAPLTAPGALLDNVGQVFGYWVMTELPERTTVFPVRMRHIAFHGPRPDGPLHCHVRITEVTPTGVTADAELSADGRVWARFTGWADRRFDTDPGIRLVDRWPGRHTLSTVDGNLALVHERWPDLATRELVMRNVLGGAERADYTAQPPHRRRHWLLGRIAAKDAARTVLWREGDGEVYPAELAVRNDDAGRPLVRGVHGFDPRGVAVSLAHAGEVGVALAGRGELGVDVEVVEERPRGTENAACDEAELALLAGLPGERAHWFTRFWAAKEAVGKALGTGLGGRPRAFRVVAATEDAARVEVDGRAFAVRLRDTANPPGLPERRYVVAWTGDRA